MMNVKLEIFEGPFDLLYKLIEKHKIDIYDIPIAMITEKYVKEVEAMQEKNMDNIGEFMSMAATLIRIKSKMLLPKEEKENDGEEEEEDPREELINKLLEYKKYKEIAEVLKKIDEETDGSNVIFKGESSFLNEIKQELDVDSFLSDVDIDRLTQTFLKLMKNQKKDKNEIEKDIASKVIRRRIYTVEEKMETIKEKIMSLDSMSFDDLFEEEHDKMEKVMTFLAVLELIKMKDIKVCQEQNFGRIVIAKQEKEKNE